MNKDDQITQTDRQDHHSTAHAVKPALTDRKYQSRPATTSPLTSPRHFVFSQSSRSQRSDISIPPKPPKPHKPDKLLTPPPIPPKRFKYKVKDPTTAVSPISPLFSPPPLPDKLSRTLKKAREENLNRGNNSVEIKERRKDISTSRINLARSELAVRMSSSIETLPPRPRHESLDKLRESSAVKQRIKDLRQDPLPVSLRDPPSNPRDIQTKSLNRRAKLSIKIEDNDEDKLWPMSPILSPILSPALSPTISSKTLKSLWSPVLAKRRSSERQGSSKGKHRKNKSAPPKPIQPSNRKLDMILRHNYYRFSGYLFDLKDIEMDRMNSQPRLYSMFAFDAECEFGLKRWHSFDCVGLPFCPTTQITKPLEVPPCPIKSATRHKYTVGKVIPRRARQGGFKKNIRSKKAFTIHEDELSSYQNSSDSAISTTGSASLFQFKTQTSLNKLEVDYKPKTNFSKSLSNLLSPGPPKKLRTGSSSSQEYDSSSSKRDRTGSLSSKSFANLLGFITSKDKT